MNKYSSSIAILVIILFSRLASAEARFPVDPALIGTVAQAWNTGKKTTIDDQAEIVGATILQGKPNIGYSEVDGGKKNGCENKACEPNSIYILPSDEINLSSVGAVPFSSSSATLSSGRHVYSGDKLQIDGSILTVSGPATIYAKEIEVISGGTINGPSNPDDLILVSTEGKIIIKDAGIINAHIFSADELEIYDTTVNGTVSTASDFKIYGDSGALNGQLPDIPPVIPPGFDTCDVMSNKDFGIAFTIESATLTEKILATKGVGGGSGSDVLIPIWTNDPNIDNWAPPGDYTVGDVVIQDTLTVAGNSYNIQLLFDSTSSSNKQGDLYYYLYREDVAVPGWYLIDVQPADFISLNSVNIVIGGEDITNVDCNITEPPEPPPGGDKTLVITPKTAQALTCDRIPVDFSVVDSNGRPVSGYNQSFVATAGSLPNGTACWSESSSGDCSGLGFTSQFVDGEKTLYLESTAVGELDVSASVSADSLSTTEGPYRFVPFGFQFNPDPAKAIAGKPFTVQVKAVADAGGSCEVIDNYTGTKDLTLSSTNYQQPASGTKVVTAKNTNVTFSQGVADLELTYLDAGHVSVTVSDPDWTKEQCGADCEDYQGEWTGLSGDADIYSRPYTFALCNIEANLVSGSVSNPQGTSIGPINGGFTAAGDLFALYSKPVIWQSGDNEAGTVNLNNKDFCSYPVTPNYSEGDALAAKQLLSIPSNGPHSPNGGEAGTLSGVVEKQHTEGVNGIYSYSGLSWNEVGSILLTSNLKDAYYDMIVNPSTIPVGRFYPAKLTLIEDHFVYPTGQDKDSVNQYVGFGYMNQEIGHDFIVEAQNKSGEPTYNYGLFDESIMVVIQYLALDDSQAEITPRLYSTTWGELDTLTWKGSAWGKPDVNGSASYARLAPNTPEFVMRKLPDSSPPTSNYTTIQDGPYNKSTSEFGLVVSNKFDGVDFETLDLNSEGKKFTQQPEFRYGRMVLKDVGGNSGQNLMIPLRTEYWDSSSEVFMTNIDDRRSTYISSSRFCRQAIWTNGTSSEASLSGSGAVVEGRDDNLRAQQPAQFERQREQVRLWLRQGDQSPQLSETEVDCSKGKDFTPQPWLQYNWRNKGDEDPSAVVTFGTFRGNDRVIFRGERGLIGN